MPTIRTIFQPETDVEVDAAEAAALRLQGLVREPGALPAPVPTAAAKPGPAVAKAPTSVSAPDGVDASGEQTDQASTSQKG